MHTLPKHMCCRPPVQLPFSRCSGHQTPSLTQLTVISVAVSAIRRPADGGWKSKTAFWNIRHAMVSIVANRFLLQIVWFGHMRIACEQVCMHAASLSWVMAHQGAIISRSPVCTALTR